MEEGTTRPAGRTGAGEEVPAPAVPREDRAAPPGPPGPAGPAGSLDGDGAAAAAPSDEEVLARRREARRARRVRGAVEWAVIIVAALLAALVIKTWLLQAFFIPSGSMEPTLHVGDRVLVWKPDALGGGVERGDLVVFSKPDSEPDDEVRDLIKRVIGLPGDRLEVRRVRCEAAPERAPPSCTRLYVNGSALEEPYLPAGTVTTGLESQVVPRDHYFVMGDNRSDSRDSRVFGPIPADRVVGRAFLRVWPPGGAGLL